MLVGKPKERGLLGGPAHELESDTGMDLGEVEWEHCGADASGLG